MYIFIVDQNRMKNAIFIAGMLLSSFVIRAGDISKYVLDNYLIPVGQSGSVVGPDISHALQCSFVE